jgi:penicillin-binding protein A
MLKKITLITIYLFIILYIIIINTKYHDYYYNELIRRTEIYVYGSSAPRGRILDRNGYVLVDNYGIKTIYYSKISNISVSDEVDIAYKLANLIEVEINKDSFKTFWLVNNNNGDNLITKEEWDKYNKRKITKEEIKKLKYSRVPRIEIDNFSYIDKQASSIYYLMNKGYSYEPKEIISGINDTLYASILEKNFLGIYGSLKWERIYNYDNTLKDIFGSVGSIPKEEVNNYLDNHYSMNDLVGISYLEKEYEKYLKGEKDLYKVNKDNTLKLVKKGSRGSDLYLSIDINLQLKLEESIKKNIIKAKKYKYTDYLSDAYGIISNPSNGEILAMSGQKLVDKEFINANTFLITRSYTVGSVVKMASMSVGYKYKVIDIDTKMVDGCIKLYSIPIKCSYKSLGKINDLSAISKSSNYYQFMTAIGVTGNNYKYNMKLNTTNYDFLKYREVFNEYGLGIITGIDLPNERTGIVGTKNSADLLLNFSIGQYDTYTPMNLITYINTLGSNGERRKPSLMKKIVNNNKTIYKNTYNIVDHVSIEDKYIKRLKEAMSLATTSGTARNYINKKYNPGGKTGTSETFIDTDLDGIMDTKTISINFVGLAPIDNPEFSIALIIPNIYLKKDFEYSKVYITRPIVEEVSKFYFENM